MLFRLENQHATFCTSVCLRYDIDSPSSKLSRQVRVNNTIQFAFLLLALGLERIHQVTNTIRIANTGWRIRICIREYIDSLYSLAHSINGMRE